MNHFGICSKCHQIINTSNLKSVDDDDPRVNKEMVDRLVGECYVEGCTGVCYALPEYQNKEMNDGIAAVRDLSSKFQQAYFIEGFVLGMASEHRSHQQAFGRMMVRAIKEFAKMKGKNTDLRNEAFVKFCDKCLPIAKSDDGNLPSF